MKVAIYIRVSTDEQAKEGFSIRAQRNLLVDYCRVNDYEVTNVYLDDGFSAKDTKRPQLQKLLADAKKGEFNAVLVYKLDRFTRSVRDLYELLEYLQRFGVGFISRQEKFDTTTAIGRAMIGILGVFAQFERELIAERVRLGMEQKTREGKKAGGRYPYGYDKEGNQIEEEVSIIRQVREIYMSGKSYQAVAAELHRKGYDRRGSEWTATNVALTLENIFYAGIIRFGGKLPNGKYPFRNRELHVQVLDVPGSHKPIWAMEEYEAHIARMRRRSSGGNGKIADYWFNGVLRCGRCGASMYGRRSNERTIKATDEKVRTSYYWCSRRKNNKSCDMPMFRQIHVEHLIMQYISQIKSDQEAVRLNKTKINKDHQNIKKEIEKHKRELSKVHARIKKWQYAFAEDLISVEDLKQRMAEETAEEQKISRLLNSLNNTLAPTESYGDVIELMDLWHELDDVDKNEAITTVFKSITLQTDYVYSHSNRQKRNEFFPASIEIVYN
jgi:site-specific DNA recombinase